MMLDMKPLLTLAVLGMLALPVAAQQPQDVPVQVPTNVELRTDVVYCRGGTRDLKLDLFLPKTGAARKPGVIFIHGGAWRGGSRRQFHRQAAHLAATLGYVGATIEHRLSGEAKFPAAVEDSSSSAEETARYLRGLTPSHLASVPPQHFSRTSSEMLLASSTA